jgi:hypothetical protein
MPTATSRANARRALLDAMAAAGLQSERLAAAIENRSEADRLQRYGAEVEATRKHLAALQESASQAQVPEAALLELARVTLATPLDLPPLADRRRGREGIETLQAELRTLSSDRGLVARARTKARRLRLERTIADLTRQQADADALLGRRLVDEGWLDAVRTPTTEAAVDAIVARLSGEALELPAARAAAQTELALERLPTALDLRPLLSRTRAEEGAAREAGDGVETEAIEAVLTSADPMPEAVSDAISTLRAARSAEHEEQRVSLEAQLAAIDEDAS